MALSHNATGMCVVCVKKRIYFVLSLHITHTHTCESLVIYKISSRGTHRNTQRTERFMEQFTKWISVVSVNLIIKINRTFTWCGCMCFSEHLYGLVLCICNWFLREFICIYWEDIYPYIHIITYTYIQFCLFKWGPSSLCYASPCGNGLVN